MCTDDGVRISDLLMTDNIKGWESKMEMQWPQFEIIKWSELNKRKYKPNREYEIRLVENEGG